MSDRLKPFALWCLSASLWLACVGLIVVAIPLAFCATGMAVAHDKLSAHRKRLDVARYLAGPPLP